MNIQSEQRLVGLREVLAGVNLRDFRDMIGGELQLVGTSVSQAFRSRSLSAAPALLMAGLRLAILLIVAIVFGSAILAITVLRTLARLRRRDKSENR